VVPVLTPLADRALTAPYRDADAAGRQAQRQIVLDAASALMQSDGPDALTMRRIAGEVDCSTSFLYTMFGGKAGVAEALWLEGFSRLHAALAEVPGVLIRSIACGPWVPPLARTPFPTVPITPSCSAGSGATL
jgi:AcrR family transcriptional regulator